MKILQFIITAIVVQVLCSTQLLAQVVGINTDTPRHLFHIDGKMNTTSSTADGDEAAADDIVITSLGRVGVGILNPTTKLHVDSRSKTNPTVPVSGFRLQDGSEAPNHVLTSDADGFARWSPVDFSGYRVIPYERKEVAFSAQSGSGSTYIYSGLYIDFPEPGRYLVSIGAKVETNRTGSEQAIFGFLKPSPNIADPNVYQGAYPVLISNLIQRAENRIILCQEIEVTASFLRAYFILEYFNTSYTASGSIFTSWGNGGIPPEAHRTGGSFVKIN
jgi:hypothetical protein